MKQVFRKSPIIRLPDWSKTSFVKSDASKFAIAGALLQEHEGQLLLIAYFSEYLNSQKKCILH